MVMSRKQNAGQNHNVKIGNKLFEEWNSSGIWEQRLQIKIPFMRKLRAD
jgi:hypothetical protein